MQLRRQAMQATGWRGGAGSPTEPGRYGLKISETDRANHFDPSWDHVIVELEGAGVATAQVTETFWSTCPELRSAEIGRWLLDARAAPWGAGTPPRIILTPVDGNRFTARLLRRRLPRGIA